MKGSLYILLVLFFSCTEKEHTFRTVSHQELLVDGEIITPKPFSDQLTVLADLLSNQEVDLKAPVSGLILDFYFKEGDFVKEGEVLIRLDDRAHQIHKKALEAERDLFEKDFKRKEALLALDAISEIELETIQDKLIIMDAQINTYDLAIDLAHIKAPFTGHLGMMDLSKGAYLNQGDLICTIFQKNVLKVNFHIPEVYISSIKTHDEVAVIIGFDTMLAKVYATNPGIDKYARSLQYRARLTPKKDGPFLPGAFAEVSLPIKQNDAAIIIPPKAVLYDIDKQTVYKISKGVVKKQEVITGIVTEEYIEILHGLEVGDTLITSGLLKIKEGITVQVALTPNQKSE